MSFVYYPYNAQASSGTVSVNGGETVTYAYEAQLDASVNVSTHPANVNAMLNYLASNNEVTDVSFVPQGYALSRANLIQSVQSAGVRSAVQTAYQGRIGSFVRVTDIGLTDASLCDMIANVLSAGTAEAVAARRSIWSQFRGAPWASDTYGQYRSFFDSGIFTGGDSIGFVLKVTIPAANVVAAPTFVFPDFVVTPSSVSIGGDQEILVKVIFTFPGEGGGGGPMSPQQPP